MKGASALELVEYQPKWLDALLPMWRASVEAGVGVTDPHPLAEQRQYFFEQVLPCNAIRVAELNELLVGFVAASGESIAQLYVRVGCHRMGIGTHLLRWAQAQSVGRLWLHTFQRNLGACAFYEHNGFVAKERGFESHWKLADVKYEWVAPKSAA